MVDVQTIGVLVTAASVSVAAIYYIMTLRVQQMNMKHTLETRQTQVFMNIFDRFNDRQIMKAWNSVAMDMQYRDYDEFLEKYGWEENPDFYSYFDLIGWTFHGMGVLVKKRQIDPELVSELCGAGLISYWEKSKPFYEEWRRRYILTAYWGIDYLYDKVKRIYSENRLEVSAPQ
jgi:hypothetical protein